MLEEAIDLMEKQKEMYIVQAQNITTKARRQVVENRVKQQLKREIQIREYIIKILKKELENDIN